MAIRDYDQVVDRAPNPYEVAATLNRGWALEHLGDIEGALRDYRKFISVSSDGFTVGQLEVHVERLLSKMN
jgi:tetratricopeptide (TPR) repeat protein